MAKTPDVKTEVGTWDRYANVSAGTALPKIYEHATVAAKDARNWYWNSIGLKRHSSPAIRAMSFFLLVCGAVLPIAAGFFTDVTT